MLVLVENIVVLLHYMIQVWIISVDDDEEHEIGKTLKDMWNLRCGAISVIILHLSIFKLQYR